MSDQEESVDSRTSMVGRKRPRDGSVELGEISGDGTSADETYNNSRKRARQDDEIEVGTSSPDGGVSLLAFAKDVGIQTDAPSITPEVRALGWNKGVQSGGMRTSFGAKKQSKYTMQPTPEDEEMLLVDEPAVIQPQLIAQQEPEELSEPTIGAIFDPFGSSGDVSSAHQPLSTLEDVATTGTQEGSTNKASSKSFIPNPLPPEPLFHNQSIPESQAAVKVSRPEPPVLQDASKVYDNYVDTKKGKSPVCVPRPTPSVFEFRGNEGQPYAKQPQKVPVPTETKQTQLIMTKKERKAAAAATAASATGQPQLLTRSEIHAAVKAACAARKWPADKTKKLLVGNVPGGFTKKQLGAYNGLKKNEQDALPAAHKRAFEKGIAEMKRRGSGFNPRQVSQMESSSHASGPITIDDEQDAEDSDSYDPETALESIASASASGSQWNPINAPAPLSLDEMLENLNETELLLQLKYFPTDDGRLYIPRCLFCTQTNHATYDCPATSCTSCGENSDHSTRSCPKTQRCGKCREQGHPASSCPSKLIRSRSEPIPCDLCGSSAHIERGCHMIWRSFFPKPDEIKTVRTFPVDCYTCGQEGHLGPDCGLYQGPGNMTWSQTNFSTYVNNSSTSQVVSAGVDYTIRSKAKKTFMIKGKANDPINLDSDDDQGFIHTKIKTSSAPKAHIQFGNMQPPSGLRGDTSRSSFAGDSYAPVQAARNQGGRYERERTFSPPPRFDRYPPPPQYHPSGGERSGGGSYQDRSRPPPQPKNPAAARRPPRKPKNNNKKAKARNSQQGGN